MGVKVGRKVNLTYGLLNVTNDRMTRKSGLIIQGVDGTERAVNSEEKTYLFTRTARLLRLNLDRQGAPVAPGPLGLRVRSVYSH